MYWRGKGGLRPFQVEKHMCMLQHTRCCYGEITGSKKMKKGVTKLLVNCSRMAQSDGVVRVNQFLVRFLPLRVAYAERLGSSAQWVMVVGVCVRAIHLRRWSQPCRRRGRKTLYTHADAIGHRGRKKR